VNEHLRERIIRKLDGMTDERAYQILDFVEFLESKYAERQNPQGNAFTRFTEAVEDRLRAGKVSAAAIAETMGLLNRAANVLNGAVAAGKSVATDIVSVAQSATRPSGSTTPPQAGPTSAKPPQPTAPPRPSAPPTVPPVPPVPPAQPPGASSPARDMQEPGSGQERL
jgi:hypothetical protein